MAEKRNTATGGTEGADVTTANSGGVHGDAFDTVSTAPGVTTLTYDSTTGPMAYKASQPTVISSSDADVQWTLSPAQARVAGRIELYLPSPGPTEPGYPGGYGVLWTYLLIQGTGAAVQLYTNDRGGSPTAQTPTAFTGNESSVGAFVDAANGTLPLDQWFRVEFDFTLVNPGSYSVKIFPDTSSITPAYSWSGARTWALSGAASSIAFGSRSRINGAFYFNNLVVNDTGMPGPSSDGWIELGGKTTSPLSFTAHTADDGKLYRAKYTSTGGVATSTPAKLTISDAVTPDPPDDTGDWPIDSLPDSTAPADGPGSATVLDLVRQFSAAVRRPVRITGPNTITMVDVNTPYLPTGFTQDDADSMYHSAARTAVAGEKTLSLEENDLALSATAELVTDDARLVASDWRIPGQLPCYGLRPTPVSRVTYTFTPDGCAGSVDFAFPVPFGIVRRS